MTIRNLDHFTKALWDWGFLDGCFAGGIRVSDLDGIVERNGKFLVLEGKSLRRGIPSGQRYMFNALKRLGCFEIVILWGEANSVEFMQIWPHDKMPAGAEDIQDFVRSWFLWANSLEAAA